MLQCSSDEAIVLAGLQFRIEKMSERQSQTPDSLATESPDSLFDGGCGGGPCTTLQPISEDKEHQWPVDVESPLDVGSPVDVGSPMDAVPSPMVEPQFYMFSSTVPTSPTETDEQSIGKIRHFFHRSRQFLCFGRPPEEDQPVVDPFGILHKVHTYVPPDYRKNQNVVKLIKVSVEFVLL